MKKILLVTFLFFSIFLYLYYDKKSCYIGLSCIYNEYLPNNTKILFDFSYPQSFVFFDKEGFEIMGEGFKYSNGYKVRKLVSYEFSKNCLSVNFLDIDGNRRSYLLTADNGYFVTLHEYMSEDICRDENFKKVILDRKSPYRMRAFKLFLIMIITLNIYLIFKGRKTINK